LPWEYPRSSIAFMQQTLASPADLLRERRLAAGLSANALARRAGVTPSTVTRIESGEVDPTFTTLQRLLAATGCDLELRASDAGDEPSLAAMATALDDEASSTHINWTRLRGLIDWACIHSDRIPALIHQPPPRTAEPLLDNLLAGIAEKLADDAGLEPPRWCRKVPPLAQPYETPGTPRMRERTRTTTPEPFAHRNIFISAESLWRAA